MSISGETLGKYVAERHSFRQQRRGRALKQVLLVLSTKDSYSLGHGILYLGLDAIGFETSRAQLNEKIDNVGKRFIFHLNQLQEEVFEVDILSASSSYLSHIPELQNEGLVSLIVPGGIKMEFWETMDDDTEKKEKAGLTFFFLKGKDDTELAVSRVASCLKKMQRMTTALARNKARRKADDSDKNNTPQRTRAKRRNTLVLEASLPQSSNDDILRLFTRTMMQDVRIGENLETARILRDEYKRRTGYELSIVPTPTKDEVRRSPPKYRKPSRSEMKAWAPCARMMMAAAKAERDAIEENCSVNILSPKTRKDKYKYVDKETGRTIEYREYEARLAAYLKRGKAHSTEKKEKQQSMTTVSECKKSYNECFNELRQQMKRDFHQRVQENMRKLKEMNGQFEVVFAACQDAQAFEPKVFMSKQEKRLIDSVRSFYAPEKEMNMDHADDSNEDEVVCRTIADNPDLSEMRCSSEEDEENKEWKRSQTRNQRVKLSSKENRRHSMVVNRKDFVIEDEENVLQSPTFTNKNQQFKRTMNQRKRHSVAVNTEDFATKEQQEHIDRNVLGEKRDDLPLKYEKRRKSFLIDDDLFS